MTATSPLHKMEAEDFAVAGVTFQNGAVGSFIASTAMYPHRTETITLHYENGSLRMDKDSLQVSWRDGQTQTLGQDHIPSDGDPLLGGKHQWHQAIIEDFADAIRTGNTPIVSGREALESHRFIQAIEQSSRTGQPQQI